MSIKDTKGNQIVTLGTIHAALFRASLWALPIFFVWFSSKFFEHDKMLDRHEMRLSYLEKSTGKGGVTQSVNVGSVDGLAGDDGLDPNRDWLTVKEVAAKEGESERTITDWIAAGTIAPMPVKDGREFHIAADYRVLPLSAANSRMTTTHPPPADE